LSKAEYIHWTNRDTNSTTYTGAVSVIQYLLFQGKAHYIDSNLTVSRTFATGNAFLVSIYSKSSDTKFGKEL